MYIAPRTALDQRIGVLIREGREIYYATVEGRHVERRTIRGLSQLLARHDETRLTRANGWGSAGQCPASACAKTPAAPERDSHLVANTSARSPVQAAVGGGVEA